MKRILISAVLLLGSTGVFAQNLNPTVEVTNNYAREASGIEKPSQLLPLPDSVFKFNLDFDYAVNSTPYQGAYEFRPYQVQLQPSARPSREGDLLLRAGLGYTFHPEITAVWTPVKTRKVRLDLFGDHHSYVGPYHTIALDADGCFSPDGGSRSGKDMRTTVGADALFSWAGGSASADIRYQNILGTHQSLGDLSRHKLQLGARVRNNPDARLVVEAGTRMSVLGIEDFSEFYTQSDASARFRFRRGQLLLKTGLETVSNSGQSAADVCLSPHYLFSVGRMQVDLGMKVAFLVRSNAAFYPSRSGVIFPDMGLTLPLVSKSLVFYAAFTGGDQMQVYSRLIDQDPFLPLTALYMDNSVELMNLSVGLRGTLAARFQYDVKGGFLIRENALLPGYVGNTPNYGFVKNLNQLYVDARARWKGESTDLSLGLRYAGTTISQDNVNDPVFQPAALTARADAGYQWGGRIHAGVSLEGKTSRKGPGTQIPAYADLGLHAQYGITRELGCWLRLGNLLNQAIQRNPFYAEKGVYVTLGISWSPYHR